MTSAFNLHQLHPRRMCTMLSQDQLLSSRNAAYLALMSPQSAPTSCHWSRSRHDVHRQSFSCKVSERASLSGVREEPCGTSHLAFHTTYCHWRTFSRLFDELYSSPFPTTPNVRTNPCISLLLLHPHISLTSQLALVDHILLHTKKSEEWRGASKYLPIRGPGPLGGS